MKDYRKVEQESALKILYYMMAADGEISKEETEEFREIAKQICGDYKADLEDIVRECDAQIGKAKETHDYYGAIRSAVEDVLSCDLYYGIIRTTGGFETIGYSSVKGQYESMGVDIRALVWDMMNIAYSDGKFHENEEKLIYYMKEKGEIEPSICLEMENAIKSLLAVRREEEWIKTANRPYNTIENVLQILAERKKE